LLGKRVLRPGGRFLTSRMLEALDIGSQDVVVELAPGLGATARVALERRPARYVAVERDADAAKIVERFLLDPRDRCVIGSAATTGLDAASATVVYGEAMLSMQTAAQKREIVREAFRVLEPGGRYGIHELGLTPDSLSPARPGRGRRGRAALPLQRSAEPGRASARPDDARRLPQAPRSALRRGARRAKAAGARAGFGTPGPTRWGRHVIAGVGGSTVK